MSDLLHHYLVRYDYYPDGPNGRVQHRQKEFDRRDEAVAAALYRRDRIDDLLVGEACVKNVRLLAVYLRMVEKEF